MNARQAVDGEVAALRREVAALRASSNGHTVDPDEIKRLKKEHKAALKAALRDGGSSSEREKEELMAAMEREVEQARPRRPVTPSTRLVSCCGSFLFRFRCSAGPLATVGRTNRSSNRRRQDDHAGQDLFHGAGAVRRGRRRDRRLCRLGVFSRGFRTSSSRHRDAVFMIIRGSLATASVPRRRDQRTQNREGDL